MATRKTVRLWNPATDQPVGAPLHAQTGVTSVAFSPDGKLLASGGLDGTVRVWNLASRRRAPPGQRRERRALGGVQRQWQAAGQRRLRRHRAAVARSLFAHPYAQLCAEAGPPTPQEWNHYASGEPQPKVCS